VGWRNLGEGDGSFPHRTASKRKILRGEALLSLGFIQWEEKGGTGGRHPSFVGRRGQEEGGVSGSKEVDPKMSPCEGGKLRLRPLLRPGEKKKKAPLPQDRGCSRKGGQ